MTIQNAILNYHEQGEFIDNITAWQKFKTWSLKQIIHELRKSGKDIRAIRCRNKNTGKFYNKWFMAGDVRRIF